ncbi:hypothetical protein L208DRAFT_1386567 [Tricholoma matsutake]|nr:hypothetical protein L208DRAFT_1386567 [Tricholoma matsutake 945]
MNLTYLSTAFIIALAAAVSATQSCRCTWTARRTTQYPPVSTLRVTETTSCSSNTVLPGISVCRNCCERHKPSVRTRDGRRMLKRLRTPRMWSFKSSGYPTTQSRNKRSSEFSIY